MVIEIQAPLPGIFYRKPSPDSPYFKEEGDVVKAGETIGLIEVMKTFNGVTAETEGILVKFLVDEEEYVNVGQPIAHIEVK